MFAGFVHNYRRRTSPALRSLVLQVVSLMKTLMQPFARVSPNSIAVLSVMLAAVAIAPSRVAAEPDTNWTRYVENTLTTLLERGTDRYGEVHSPQLMAILDLDTLTSPAEPQVYDSLIRLEGRIHRRAERGSNLWSDQPTLRAMYRLSQLSSNATYAQGADAYVAYALENCRNRKGLLYWGSHVHWDCYQDRPAGDRGGEGPHEILVHDAVWAEMYRVNPQAVREIADAVWDWHINDHETGRHNRHDDKSIGREFSFSGSSFIDVQSFLYQATNQPHFLDRAKRIAQWHYSHRHPVTGLPAELPQLAGDTNGLYGRAFMTSLTGPHAAALLRAYERTGDRYFYDVATSYLKAYDKYAWNEEAETYLGMLNLDGTPTTLQDVPAGMRSQVRGYGANDPDPEYSVPPIGPIEVWQTTIFPLEFPLESAEAALHAYEISQKDAPGGDPQLLASAKRWAGVIESQLPPHTGSTFRQTLRGVLPGLSPDSGTYAGSYGRSISFFVHLYRATDETKFLDIAMTIAEDAVEKLYQETTVAGSDGKPKTYGLFRGHPAKPYYESVDHVGLLLYALLELDRPDEDLGWVF